MKKHITIDPRVARLAALQQANPPGNPRLWDLHLEPRAKERVQRVTVTNGKTLLSVSGKGLVLGDIDDLHTERAGQPPDPDIVLERSAADEYVEVTVNPRMLGELLLAIDDLLQMNNTDPDDGHRDTTVKMSVCNNEERPIFIDSKLQNLDCALPDEGVHAAIMGIGNTHSNS